MRPNEKPVQFIYKLQNITYRRYLTGFNTETMSGLTFPIQTWYRSQISMMPVAAEPGIKPHRLQQMYVYYSIVNGEVERIQ